MLISREEFIAYEKVRKSGKYNMVTNWELASKEARLTKEMYFEIIKRYNSLYEKYIRH